MTVKSVGQVEFLDETECPLQEASCPHCSSLDVVQVSSYIRDV
ncbi:MAG: hypothetical protein ACTSRW_17475 [Candidatus Helarchaeota archaeon]